MKKSRPLSVMALLALSAAVCQAQSEERVDTLATSVVTAYHSGGGDRSTWSTIINKNMQDRKEKRMYISPECEVLTVAPEGTLCGSEVKGERQNYENQGDYFWNY